MFLGGFLVDIEKLILNFIWEGTGSRIAKTILKKENKVGGITVYPLLRLTCRYR